MNKNQEKKMKEMKHSQTLDPKTSQEKKEKKNIKEAPLTEDWEGGGSQPQEK